MTPRSKRSNDAAPDAGLRERVRSVVQRDVLRASAAKCRGWMVLVLDAAATRALTPVLGLYDLVEERVTLVESLEKRRQPFPEMTAVYVVAAAERSIRAVCADWRGRDCVMYADAHVFALDTLDDNCMGLLGGTPELGARLKALSELRLDFHALEARAFDLGEPGAFKVSPGASKIAALSVSDKEATRKLATVLATLGCGRPSVRYRSGNARCRAAGKLLVERLGDCAADQSPCDVLLLDRGDDVLTPLVHEYSYQALVHDVLVVEGAARDRVPLAAAKRGGEGASDYAVLTDRDALWVEFRHQHVARVVSQLRSRTTDFLKGNKGAADLRCGRGAELSLGDMAAALRQMPEFQAATAALNKHMSVAHAALDEFSKRSLLEQSQLEQTLATGRDEDGARRRPRDLADAVAACLKGRGSDAHALRLLAVYVVAAGGRLKEQERKDLFGALGPDAPSQRALLCLAQLVAKADGVPTRDDATAHDDSARARTPPAPAARKTRSTPVRRLAALRAAMKATFKSTGSTEEAQGDVESRYAPPAKALLFALCDGALDAELYPSLGSSGGSSGQKHDDRPRARSARKAASRLAVAGSRQPAAFGGPKVVVCVLGGATYSELRAAYEVAAEKGRDVVLGGSRFLAPDDFVASLAA